MRLECTFIFVSTVALMFGSADAQELRFDLQIANSGASIFRLENTSTIDAEIVGFSGFIGDTSYNFDSVADADILTDAGSPLTGTLTTGDPNQGGARTDDFAFALTGFEVGDRFATSVDLDLDTGDSGADFREIYFNNGDDVPNASFTVTFQFGNGQTQTLTLVLPDDPFVDDPQRFDFSASQQVVIPALRFDLQIANSGASIFRLENTSTIDAEIVGFSGFIGDTSYNFDSVADADILTDAGSPLTGTLTTGDPNQGGARTDDFAFALTGFEVGDRFATSVDLDLDTGDSGADFREIYFNNGDDVPNASFTVTFQFGNGQTQTLTLVLPDDPFVDDPQRFDFSAFEQPSGLLGDVNRDGDVDFFDIAPFIDLLSSQEFQIEGDTDVNGVVDFFDIAPFIDLLSNQ